MMRSVLSAAIVSLLALSGAWALPVSSTATLPQLTSSDIVQVGKKNYNKHYNKNYKHYNRNSRHYNHNYKYRGRYHYGNRYWGHRYNYRPYNWQALGCIVVGPVWYCP